MRIGDAAIVLLGAEGCSELKDSGYLQEPTKEQELEFYEQVRHWASDKESKHVWRDPRSLTVDGNNRPYWLKVVTDVAPEKIREIAYNSIRCVRL